MENVQGKKAVDLHGHVWNDLDKPTLDDDGEYSRYAKCSKCGAVENTEESIMDCK